MPCRKLTSLMDKVEAKKLDREFKTFNAFMKQLDERGPVGVPFSKPVAARNVTSQPTGGYAHSP